MNMFFNTAKNMYKYCIVSCIPCETRSSNFLFFFKSYYLPYDNHNIPGFFYRYTFIVKSEKKT